MEKKERKKNLQPFHNYLHNADKVFLKKYHNLTFLKFLKISRKMKNKQGLNKR